MWDNWSDIVRIVLFGSGIWYQRNINKIHREDSVVAFIDNKSFQTGICIDGIPMYKPEQIGTINYDIVILMSVLKSHEMKDQLSLIGVEGKKIWYWGQYCAYRYSTDKFHHNELKCNGRSILFIHRRLGYDGGAWAILNAATVMQRHGVKSVLWAPDIDERFAEECMARGIDFEITPSLPYINELDVEWAKKFDYVVVNTFAMVKCVVQLEKIKPTLWWIHEPEEWYPSFAEEFKDDLKAVDVDMCTIRAVSNQARSKFGRYISNQSVGILPFSVPDEGKIGEADNSKVVLAIIGAINPLKGHDILLDALEEIDLQKYNCEVWVIGFAANEGYGKQIIDRINPRSEIFYKGVLTKEELYRTYCNIDVVVAPSREDTLSTVLAEGMMFSKTCIMSDHTGMADYVIDGYNGFVVESENAESLRKRILWALRHKDRLCDIGLQARKVYETYFSEDRIWRSLKDIFAIE